jgi:hypothetical protein
MGLGKSKRSTLPRAVLDLFLGERSRPLLAVGKRGWERDDWRVSRVCSLEKNRFLSVVLCKSVMQVVGILGIAPSGVLCKSALGAERKETVRRFDLWFTQGSGWVSLGPVRAKIVKLFVSFWVCEMD